MWWRKKKRFIEYNKKPPRRAVFFAAQFNIQLAQDLLGHQLLNKSSYHSYRESIQALSLQLSKQAQHYYQK